MIISIHHKTLPFSRSQILMVLKTYILKVVHGHKIGNLVSVSFQLVYLCVVGLLGPSFSFNLCHVGANLFDGGSSFYRRCVYQFFPHAPSKGPSTYCPSTRASLCIFGPLLFPLCHCDFCFNPNSSNQGILNLWVNHTTFSACQKYELNPPQHNIPCFSCGALFMYQFSMPLEAMLAFSGQFFVR